MNSSLSIWIILAAAVILIGVIALVVMRMSGGEAKRRKAEQIRAEAAEHEREVRLREAEADKADAAARQAAAAADEQSAQATRLAAEADEQAARARVLAEEARVRGEEAHGVRSEHTERLREADRIDPDVPTDKDGVRTDGQASGATTAAAGGAAAAAASPDRREGVTGDRDGDGTPNALDPNDGGATGGWGGRDDEQGRDEHGRDEHGGDEHDRREGLTGDRDGDGTPNALDPNDGPVDRDGDGIDDREEEHWDRAARERDTH